MNEQSNIRLLYPLNVWALSFGSAVGWGAFFMMPGSLFLPLAGPVGSIIAIAIASIAMLIIGANFCRLAQKYQDNGGFFTYVREVMGYDHAFLTGWALLVAYLSILWANATSVAVLIRYIFGDALVWGLFHYKVAGFDVYGGEVLTTLAVLLIFGLFSAYGGKTKRPLNTLLALVLLFGLLLLFFGVAAMSPQHASFYPPFAAEGSPGLQIFSLLMLAPWMFFGFESVTQGGAEFRFPVQRIWPLIIASSVCIFLGFSLPIAISVLSIPPEFAGWPEYVGALSNLKGLDSLPVFHSVSTLLGSGGLMLLTAVVIAAMATGLIGLFRACSFLLQAMAHEQLLPEIFSRQTENGTPRNAVFLIMLLSLPIPFLGRTAIVWLVDAITISGALAYAYVSLCRYRISKAEGETAGKVLGLCGLVISLLFFFCPIIPDLLSGSNLKNESYLLLSVWSVLGLVFYWYVFKHDAQNRFGKSFSMCTVLLFLNFFSSSLWLRQTMASKIPLARMGGYAPVNEALTQNCLIQILLILLILFFMADIFTTMRRRELALNELAYAEQKASRTNSVYLANMTHDIRLMMNAIMSYVQNATDTKREYQAMQGKCPAENLGGLWQGLSHTDSISHYFLHLVEDMRNFSRITGSELTLFPVPMDIRNSLQEIQNIFAPQMQSKNIDFMACTAELENPYIYCDNNRLQRVLLNIISLAYDYTPSGGSISVTLAQRGPAYQIPPTPDDQRHLRLYADYELRIKNTGACLPDTLGAIFYNDLDWHQLFKQEGAMRTMAIAKHLLDLFHAKVEIESTTEPPEQSTEMIIRLSCKLAKQSAVPMQTTQEAINMY